MSRLPKGWERAHIRNNANEGEALMAWDGPDGKEMIVMKSFGDDPYKYTIKDEVNQRVYGKADKKQIAKGVAITQIRRIAEGENGKLAPKGEVNKAYGVSTAFDSRYELYEGAM